jgi:hypothetical protein
MSLSSESILSVIKQNIILIEKYLKILWQLTAIDYVQK